jgi:hypothetical protein
VSESRGVRVKGCPSQGVSESRGVRVKGCPSPSKCVRVTHWPGECRSLPESTRISRQSKSRQQSLVAPELAAPTRRGPVTDTAMHGRGRSMGLLAPIKRCHVALPLSLYSLSLSTLPCTAAAIMRSLSGGLPRLAPIKRRRVALPRTINRRDQSPCNRSPCNRRGDQSPRPCNRRCHTVTRTKRRRRRRARDAAA